MGVQSDHLEIVKSEECVAVEIPFRDLNISMTIIVPEDF